MSVLYIVRGIPGSGKSTIAKKLVGDNYREADMYFMKDGKYEWKREDIKKAHAWCHNEIENLMIADVSDIAVSNTFVKMWEYEPYIDLAIQYNYHYVVLECYGEFENTHNVPKEVVERMKTQFEPYNFKEK
jgi:predicted kinase